MSREKIEQYIKELEAIRCYDEVKREKDRLAIEVKKLEGMLSLSDKEAERLREDIKRLGEEVGGKEKEIKALKNEVVEKDKDIGQLNEKMAQLESRVAELENLKATAEGKTLKEAEEVFLKAKENEVEQRAENLFTQMKLEWEKTSKPNEVFSKSIELLKSTVEALAKPGPRYFLKEVVDAGLPGKVEEIIGSEVRRRLDSEFLRRVEEKSDEKASAKLNQMVNVEWPNWLRANVDPKAKELEEKIIANALSLLKGPCTITCGKCGTGQTIEFTPQGIGDLLRNRYAMVECSNPNCRDLFTRHLIKVELKAFILSYISPSSP